MAKNISILISWIATTLILVPFLPEFPFATLDASWKYGLNEAVSRHLIFGKDVIMGLGPLSPVYIRMYHPGTDLIMIGFSILFSVALAAGCSLLSPDKRSYVLLGLPIFLSQMLLFDAVFLIIPFLFLLIVTRWNLNESEPQALTLAGITLLGTAVSILPLVKGSFTGPALACGGLAWILIARRSRFLAAVVLIWAIASIAVAWKLAGQPLGAIPEFLRTQGQIVSGYGEAMSTNGKILQVIVFIVAAVWMVRTFIAEASARFGKNAAAPILGLVLTLFVALKAGFIRHDVHALIAASSLVLTAYLSLLMFRSRRVAHALLVSVLAWGFIAYRHLDLSPVSDLLRLVTALRDSSRGVMIRVFERETLRRRFDEALDGIRQDLPFPPFDGTVDLYPTDVVTVLANRQKWAPRPVLQSYSAYTPVLLELNRKHLTGKDAPDRIYFSISPIDGHYPSTEDGASWMELLSRYQVRSFVEPYAVLERRNVPLPVTTGNALLESEDGRLGNAIRIPSSDSPIWASIDLSPSWVGSAYGALFKLTPLRLTIQYQDGTSAPFRFIPGTARAGFLLSPTVHTSAEFAALQRPQQKEYFKGRKLVSLEISTKVWIQRLLWKRRYAIRLSELHVTPDENIPADSK